MIDVLKDDQHTLEIAQDALRDTSALSCSHALSMPLGTTMPREDTESIILLRCGACDSPDLVRRTLDEIQCRACERIVVLPPADA